MNAYQVIKNPLVTEKSMMGQGGEKNCYAFVVHHQATKIDVRHAVEKLFKVKVSRVNTSIVRGKVRRFGRYSGRRSNWKKALVLLKPGERIELFEGVS